MEMKDTDVGIQVRGLVVALSEAGYTCEWGIVYRLAESLCCVPETKVTFVYTPVKKIQEKR